MATYSTKITGSSALRGSLSSGGITPTSIIQAPATGFIKASGYFKTGINNNDGYSLIVASATGAGALSASGRATYYPGAAAGDMIVKDDAGNTNSFSDSTLADQVSIPPLMPVDQTGLVVVKDLIIPAGWHLNWYVSGGSGATAIAYQFQFEIFEN